MRKKLLVFISFLLLTAVIYAQDAVSDLLKINNTYYSAKNISMKMNYALYSDATATAPLQTEKGEIRKENVLSYSRYGDVESIVNHDYYVVVDHEQKEILISKIYRGMKEENPMQDMPEMLKKIVKRCDKVDFKETGKDLASYTFSGMLFDYSKVSIVFNKKTFLIEKIICYYNKKTRLSDDQKVPETYPRLEISYSDMTLNSNINSTVFTYEKYLTKSKGKFICKPAYNNYNLTDFYNNSK